ncbi:MAG: acyl--CoA ligase [Verrucomicrobia bacterium]|nr:acyl--CoA ligase [Verrucomicrobiota bacterium]
MTGRFADRDCVVTDVDRLTYREVDERSRALAKRLLAHGAGKGAHIGGHFPYGTDWIVSWLAVTRIGAVYMPFSTAFKPGELRKALRHGDVALLLAPRSLFGSDHRGFVTDAVPGLADRAPGPLHLAELPYLRDVWFDLDDSAGADISDELLDAVESEVSPADVAITIYTSGTTSEPKGVLHTHGALVRKGAQLAALQAWTADDRIFCGMPFFWVGGVGMTVVPSLHVGAALLCIDRTEPIRSLDLMQREAATKLTGWPGVIGPITTDPTAADRGIPALHRPLSLVGARHSSLGMTETIASYTYATPEQQAVPLPEGHTGSMGWIIDGAEVRIADPDTLEPLADGEEGAILVRGYFVMQGMVKREREDVFTPDGFYNTGDKGYLLGDNLYLKGRLTEMIKTSGNNVAPPEVEAVLRSFPEVKDAHVLGVPDAERGELVAALVIPADGADPDPDDLRERARAELSNFKVPRVVVLAREDELPWLATGKPDRLAIRAMLADAVARRPASG